MQGQEKIPPSPRRHPPPCGPNYYLRASAEDLLPAQITLRRSATALTGVRSEKTTMSGKSQNLFKDGNEFVGNLADWKLEFTKAEQSEFPERYVGFPYGISSFCLVLVCLALPRISSGRLLPLTLSSSR